MAKTPNDAPKKANGAARRGDQKMINVALQGGGSHGAFAWGVLDHLLSDDRLYIEALSGASAGAMNAIICADGWAKNGCEGARKALSDFWYRLSDVAQTSPLQRGPVSALMGAWSLDQSPFYLWFDLMSRIASPYDLNPFNWNPIRDLLNEHVDFEGVRKGDGPRLYITATNVETGRARVFQRPELTADHIMASACLPLVFQAVLIDGKPYWDGGYMGNPSLWPLYGDSESDDIIIVQINPIDRGGVPRTSREILNRLNEITFNASLLSELRAIDFVSRLITAGRLEGSTYRDIHVHVIGDDKLMTPLGESSKMLAERAFLELLRDSGKRAAERWVKDHFDDIGARSTVDLRDFFELREDGVDRHPVDAPAPPTDTKS